MSPTLTYLNPISAYSDLFQIFYENSRHWFKHDFGFYLVLFSIYDLHRELSVQVVILDTTKYHQGIKNIIGSSILVFRFWYCVKKLCSNWNLFHTHSVIMWFPSFCDRIKWNESSDMVPFLPIFVIFTPNGNISPLSHIFNQLPRVRNTLLWVMDDCCTLSTY